MYRKNYFNMLSKYIVASKYRLLLKRAYTQIFIHSKCPLKRKMPISSHLAGTKNGTKIMRLNRA